MDKNILDLYKQYEKPENKDFKAIRAIVVAPSDRGKSWQVSDWVIQMIKDECFHPNRILIFSETYVKDPSQRKLIDFCNKLYPPFEKSNCFKDVDVNLLNYLYLNQEYIKENTNKHLHNYLVLYDDQICNDQLLSKKSPLKKMMVMGRHMNISQIFLLQSYRASLNPIIRRNISVLAVGLLTSQEDIEDLLKAYNGGMGDTKKEAFQRIKELYDRAVSKHDNRGFLLIHCNKIYGEHKFQEGFNGEYYD